MKQQQRFTTKTQIQNIILFGMLSLLLTNSFTDPILFVQGYTYQFSSESSATYEINYELNYTLTEAEGSILRLWFSRLNNWTDSELSNDTQIQQSTLKSLSSNINTENYSFDETDIYGNSYDYFSKDLAAIGQGSRFFTVKYNYAVTLNSAQWDIPKNITTDVYDQTSSFYQFYTKAQPYCEVDDPLIQAKAQEIVGEKQGIVEKAQEIYLFIVENMKYQLQSNAIGAKLALIKLLGDCSEFSSLMVALLRAQGIPARKVLGFGLVSGNIEIPQPLYTPRLGDTWNYSSKAKNLPGHAWVQYYIPGYGWISSDPTWGQALYDTSSVTSQKNKLALEYFNRIDTCHLITTIGDWFGEGIDPEIPFEDGGMAEFPYIALLASRFGDWNLQIAFEITNLTLGSQGTADSEFWSWIVIGGSGAIILFVTFMAYYAKKSQKNRIKWQY